MGYHTQTALRKAEHIIHSTYMSISSIESVRHHILTDIRRSIQSELAILESNVRCQDAYV
jgi:hypothetical protein